MVKDSSGWRPCYLHSSRPAIGECERCGKPICSTCVAESGIARCCPQCVPKPAGLENPVLEDSPPIPPSPTRRVPDPFGVGEVTIHADGTVEAPETPPAGEPEAVSTDETPPLEEVRAADKVKPVKTTAVKEDAALEAGVSLEEPPPPSDKQGEKTPGRAVKTSPPKAAPAEKTAVEPAKTDSRKGGAKAEKAAPEAAGAGKGKRISERISRITASNTTVSQLLYGVPFGLIAGVLIYGFWVLLAFLRRQWVQTSVLTAGIAIPWALFKGTTFKKLYGKPVYETSPKALYLALTSFVIMAILFVVAEYAAFAVVYRGSDLANPLKLFVDANSGALDIVQIVVGFLLSISLPYWLKLGERKRPQASSEE